MLNVLKLFMKLIIGFIFCASSTVFMLNSNLGLSPWDVFHEGLSNISGMTIGQANIIVSLCVIILGILLGQKLGIGTILNILIVGKFIDLINESNIIPVANNLFTGVLMMIIGMLTMGYGCYLYISCGLGCGPRDGVMLSLSEKLNKPIKIIRAIIEVTVLVTGFILGGTVGIGTFISAFGLGYCIQLIFKMFKFDATNVRHKSILECLDFNSFLRKFE